MKTIARMVFMIVIIIVVYIFKDNISNFILNNVIYRDNNQVLTYNEYYIENDYSYVQNIDSNKVKNKKDLLNIFYTTLNSGDDNFTFYCGYDDCLNDVKDLIDNGEEISNINNFVHPYNSYKSINIDMTNSGKITIKTKKTYSSKKIEYINNYIDEFISNNITDNMSETDKIKAFHDYVINNTIYDKDNERESYSAYDLITTGKSICGGYSDIMAIYLNKLGIQNYKITSSNHIWNLVKIDDEWYHLDLTWDDPVASDGNQYLLHNFFLIKTDELLKLDAVEHTFDKNIYKEAN